jgi:hypothetical protein
MKFLEFNPIESKAISNFLIFPSFYLNGNARKAFFFTISKLFSTTMLKHLLGLIRYPENRLFATRSATRTRIVPDLARLPAETIGEKNSCFVAQQH